MASTSPSDGHGSTPAGMRPPPVEVKMLPHGRLFPLQIGSELFKLSGASLCSDAPSYFTQYFLRQLVAAEQSAEEAAIRILHVDRDPETFRDIALHLQGYPVSPRDGTHFVRLLTDAQFYSPVPKLTSQLFEGSIFVSIGHREFQLPRDLLTSATNSPNFFSLGSATIFNRADGLNGDKRSAVLVPPSAPKRSADTFAELLRLLKGYAVRIRDETHREELLRDARYFRFKGLEQQLIPHAISFNPIRRREEICLRLENVQKSGVSVAHEQQHGEGRTMVAWVNYARPYVDGRAAELVLEIGGDATRIHWGGPDGPRADFFRDTKARVGRLFEVVATKLNLPLTTQPLGLLMASGGASSQPATPGNTPLSEDLVRVHLSAESAVVLDGRPLVRPELDDDDDDDGGGGGGTNRARRKRRRVAPSTGFDEEVWFVRTGQWRLRIQGCRGGKSAVECVLVAVKLDAITSELGRNLARGFLGC
ncbi:hypothetical protein XA68_12069 [Ophiocordyceps unilateralis]|uniref:Potassium channel tetramerisation-type BTB domain-containing protein n=1 Tax=Ophiocordyceps unilateralis TaxID=268505 RepID=A0A2A9PFG5_OPHUN|nr:hypothetical protein XA68_12069 [Ophiocordyceps unilateralis]